MRSFQCEGVVFRTKEGGKERLLSLFLQKDMRVSQWALKSSIRTKSLILKTSETEQCNGFDWTEKS